MKLIKLKEGELKKLIDAAPPYHAVPAKFGPAWVFISDGASEWILLELCLLRGIPAPH